MPIIIFFLMNLIVSASAFLFTYKFFRFIYFIDSLIALFIIYFAQIVISELFLGLAGILNLQNIIILNFLIFLAAWLISYHKKYYFNYPGLNNILTQANFNKITLLITSAILGFGSIKLFINLINPPFGWDSLNYHFTFPVEWMKNGNLNNPIVVSDDPFPSYYPINGSLLFLWLIFPFKNAFFADLGQLPFFIISFLAAFSISVKLGLSKEHSFLASAIFIIIPNFFKQLGLGYIDIMVAALFLTALNFILCLRQKFALGNIIAIAVSLGLFIGIKTTSLPYSIFILFPFFYILLSQKHIGFKAKAGQIALFAFLAIIFGGFSYFRNFALTGNPFYPLNVTILGKSIFKGVIDKVTFISRNEPQGYSLTKLLFHEGLGIQSLLIIFPAACFALPINALKNKHKGLIQNYILSLPLLLYLAYRFILPIPNSRYLYPMLAIGAIVGYYALDAIKMPQKIIRIASVILIIASAFESARRFELIISLTLSLLLFAVFTLLLLKYEKLKMMLFSKTAIALSTFALFMLLQGLLLDYKSNEYLRYVKNSRYWADATRAWLWLNNNTAGNNIAYIGRPVPYPLYGENLKNNVYYVSVNSLEPVRLHDFKKSRYRWDNAENMHRSFEEAGNYRENADYSLWLNNLNKKKTDFLFIYSLHHTKEIAFPIEELWARGHLDKFNLVFSNSSIRIYKLIK